MSGHGARADYQASRRSVLVQVIPTRAPLPPQPPLPLHPHRSVPDPNGGRSAWLGSSCTYGARYAGDNLYIAPYEGLGCRYVIYVGSGCLLVVGAVLLVEVAAVLLPVLLRADWTVWRIGRADWLVAAETCGGRIR